jgi:ABC-type nitrate/sulfonate/bicarbonate transport system substrate-binding protein
VKNMRALRFLTVAMALLATCGVGSAQETLKLAIGQRGNWDTSVSELGQRAGIFKKYGLELEILYTQGGGETQQAVISGSVDIGVGAGVMGVLGAFSKGAPVRVIGAVVKGGADVFWYVKAQSPIRSLKDAGGKTVAYSTTGSSSHEMANVLTRENGVQAKLVATGGPSATLTQVISDQIDVGWSAPPFGLDMLDENKIRIVARGSDAKELAGQTVRLLITNVQTLKGRKAAIERYMKAYRETLDWMYGDPGALKAYADFVGIPLERAQRTRDEFFPKAALDPDRIDGLDAIMPEAVTLKFIAKPVTAEQLSEMVQIPPRS